MIDLLLRRREAIAAACARYKVARLDAFGSALRHDFVPGESDIDLLVELAPMDRYERVVSASLLVRPDIEPFEQ